MALIVIVKSVKDLRNKDNSPIHHDSRSYSHYSISNRRNK